MQGLIGSVSSNEHYCCIILLYIDTGVVVHFDGMIGENSGAIVVEDLTNR